MQSVVVFSGSARPVFPDRAQADLLGERSRLQRKSTRPHVQTHASCER